MAVSWQKDLSTVETHLFSDLAEENVAHCNRVIVIQPRVEEKTLTMWEIFNSGIIAVYSQVNLDVSYCSAQINCKEKKTVKEELYKKPQITWTIGSLVKDNIKNVNEWPESQEKLIWHILWEVLKKREDGVMNENREFLINVCG